MARNPDLAKIWADARVFLSDAPTRPALPTDIATDVDDAIWPEAGILDGDDGFSEDRSSDEAKHYGWGIGLIKIGAKNFELSRKFSPLEDNPTVRGLVWPGSTETKLVMPKPVYRWIGFETTSDFGDKERLWSTQRARIWVPANNRNESDITKWEVQCGLFANGAGELFDRQASTSPVTKTVALGGSPTGGTFTLTVDGQTTAGIAYDATAAAVKTAVGALSTVGASNVTVTGSAGGPYTVTLANGGTLTGSGASLTPSGTVTVS
ncbi:hypothetical protein G4X40_18550 [Rhodococcus sp. D2-41]|uniref:hypothetical protein n=1 Tax=Speluncibacter jeojiensis TaxID=2710754 RepID=UPI00240EDC9A|nr:hypothetical protein [Rhodococcus sp. D2-41]MDG3012146.1 hypothetical protein [Rhodococcus sp. D2-41]